MQYAQFVTVLVVLLAPVALRAQTSRLPAAHAVTTDQSSETPPAGMAELTIQSHGSRMNGLLYTAGGGGEGLHPVVIFLHGYPGNERNLDLAQAVRRAGYHALYFDYRGNWGSGGAFSMAHGLEDVEAALAWVRNPKNASQYKLDARHIAIVGHSYGGWLALMTAARQPTNVCVAGMAAWNVGWDGQRFATRSDERKLAVDGFRTTADTNGGPVHANAEEMVAAMSTNAAAWNYLATAPALKSHALLLVAATRDSPDEGVDMHKELADAVKRAGGRQVRSITFDDDHPFSSHRIALAEAVISWLQTDCASSWMTSK